MERSGWIEKDRPACCPGDAVVKPLALAPCTSDIHTVWEGARGTTSSWGTRRSGWWTRWETKSGTSNPAIGSLSLEAGVMLPDMLSTGFMGAENAHIEIGAGRAVRRRRCKNK